MPNIEELSSAYADLNARVLRLEQELGENQAARKAAEAQRQALLAKLARVEGAMRDLRDDQDDPAMVAAAQNRFFQPAPGYGGPFAGTRRADGTAVDFVQTWILTPHEEYSQAAGSIFAITINAGANVIVYTVTVSVSTGLITSAQYTNIPTSSLGSPAFLNGVASQTAYWIIADVVRSGSVITYYHQRYQGHDPHLLVFQSNRTISGQPNAWCCGPWGEDTDT
jgi:hypothetical protein